MIVVTGASGHLGGRIVRHLLARIPASQLGVSVRNPERIRSFAAEGVRVRQADYDDVPSLARAFEGASQLLLVSSNAQAHGGDPLSQHRNAIDAAKKAGVERIAYTSHMAASPTSKFPPMRTHASTEDMLAESGLRWVALRNGFYASGALREIAAALPLGRMELPEDGPVAWTGHDDLAECAATLLTSDSHWDGPTPSLTAAQALDFSEVAEIASGVLGKPIKRLIVSDTAMAEKLAFRGLTIMLQELAMSFYAASRAGEFSKATPALAQLIGREPKSLASLVGEIA